MAKKQYDMCAVNTVMIRTDAPPSLMLSASIAVVIKASNFKYPIFTWCYIYFIEKLLPKTMQTVTVYTVKVILRIYK